IMDFGAFVEFMPNRDGLLHISEISWERLPDMAASGLKEGDEVDVKLIEIDKKTGKYRLSMRVLKEKPEGYVEPQRRERPPRGEGGQGRERREGRDGNRGPRREGGNNRGPRHE
ncbi:MAG: S1 RNA-binding domain-containing protein, partial [Muribaculaceae bacterium]|nr:S1 RNA-binding domain-containing protein [Muribaculaceae bacterium]